MPYTKKSLVSFNAGELSPKMDARVDLAKYGTGCRTVENAIVGLYGEAERRPGTQFIAEVKDSAKKVRLVDFQFSTTTTFTLEVGDGYVRFYSNGVRVMDGPDPYEIVSPYEVDDLFQIQFAQTNDVAYLTHPSYPVHKLSRLADDDWTLVPVVFDAPALLEENVTDTTITPSATTGTGITLEASDPIFEAGHVGSYWQIAHLRDSSFVNQDITSSTTSGTLPILGDWNVRTYGIWSADILVQRSTDNGTTWETIRSFAGREDRNVDATGTQDEEALFRIKIENWVAASPAGATTPRVVLEAVDAYIYGLVKITAFTDSTHVTADVVTQMHAVTATKTWSEGAWSAVRGYPRAVTIFEQSTVYGGTNHQPQTIWKSVTGDYENFRYGTDDTDAVAYTIGSKRQQTILWLVAQKALMIGTTSGEWAMSGGDQNEPLSPTNVVVKPQSEHGSAALEARLVGDVVLFVQRNGRKVRELTYSLERDKYVAPDLTILAEHVTQGGIVQLASQQLPINILWAVTANGVLIGMTYEREQDVVGWHRHVTDGFVESVAVIYGESDDEVWLVVRRTIDGDTKRYVERFHARFDPAAGDTKEEAFFVDCGLSYSGAPADVFSGLEHLEGKTVSILADGAPVPDQVVQGGEVTLPNGEEASVVHIGLPFVTTVKPMRLDVDPTVGVSQGQVKRIIQVFLRFLNTLGCVYGDGKDYENSLPFRDTSDAMDESPPLFTGDKEVEFDGDFEYEGDMVVKQTQPLPMTLLAIVVKYEVSGR